jgi:hypothetical protein
MRAIELCTTGLRTFVACLTVIASVASAAKATAQSATTVSPGARIRITAPGALSPAEQSGRLVSLRSDSLVLQPDGSESALAVPSASVTELDVSDGQHTRTGRGLAIGALVGAGVGAGIGAATYSNPECKGGNFGECLGAGIAAAGGRGGRAAALGLLGAVSGAVVGALVGHAHSSDDWRRVNNPVASLFRIVPEHLSVAPLPRGLAVSLQI